MAKITPAPKNQAQCVLVTQLVRLGSKEIKKNAPASTANLIKPISPTVYFFKFIFYLLLIFYINPIQLEYLKLFIFLGCAARVLKIHSEFWEHSKQVYFEDTDNLWIL